MHPGGNPGPAKAWPNPAQNGPFFYLKTTPTPRFLLSLKGVTKYNLGSKNRTKKLTAQPGPPSGRLPPQTLLKSSWAISILIILNQPKQPPKSGYGFLQAVVSGVVSRAGALVEILDAPHKEGGNPGYPAEAMLSTCIMQFALGERYANAFLNTLDSNVRLLAICGLPWAPSERAYSQFKKHKLAHHKGLMRSIIVYLFLECGIEIERLRALGLVPADKLPLGHSLVMDSTDIEAWARPGRKGRKTGEEKPSKDSDARWGHRTAKNARSYKARSGKGRSVKKGTGKKGAAGQKESKDELYFGYKVNVIVDANHGLPLFAETRPGNASDVTVMIQDLDDCLALYQTLNPRYFLGDKGYDSLKNILHVISLVWCN